MGAGVMPGIAKDCEAIVEVFGTEFVFASKRVILTQKHHHSFVHYGLRTQALEAKGKGNQRSVQFTLLNSTQQDVGIIAFSYHITFREELPIRARNRLQYEVLDVLRESETERSGTDLLHGLGRVNCLF